ncbi:MAG: hypothetical protein HKN90_10375, partial [Flavobacteriaceae bacterium]|nr:hypothetical protein [Flavobacteriaceae bacterium]
MIQKILRPFILFFILYGSNNLWSQDTIVNSSAYEVFDHMVGHTNTGIFDGIEYFEKFPVRNDKYKFFKSSDFEKGSLIYDGNPFLNIELKYDVYDGNLLIRNSEVLGSPVTQLYKEKISSFYIAKHTFVHLRVATNKDEPLQGFFELLINDENLKLYKQHRKKMIKKTDDGVYYEFKDDPRYILYTNESFFKLKNENSMLTIFPEYKEQLKSFIHAIEK